MELNIRNRKATVAVDNTAIITKKNGTADLLFIQITREAETAEGDIVAAVRLNSIAELEDLKKTIDEAIKKHKNLEREM